ncbi:MAG: hypothetical protein KA354_22875 [Phycisphaerae bacterium]|nr:hypothetical protein [Phycisphaerae bacterium]
MTFNRIHIGVFLGLAVLVWGSALLIQGVPVGREHLGPFGTVLGFLVLLGIGFEHVLWRQPWLQGWFVKRPDLRGTWRVDLRSDWVDPDTGERIPSIVGYMGVTQTLSKLQLHLMTPESESWFIADRIISSPCGDGYQVVGVYTNKPHVHLRGNRSEMHYGALVLQTHGQSGKPESLTGEYWTDRKTAGSMTLSSRIADVASRFEDAESQATHKDARHHATEMAT